ncbi:MAG: ammonium transporter [Deltaproteobacteria bacterium]|nr:ammonium transporter [Candidatus Anaeroferrophillus wilburensis]MBN2887732.1 ammonium transporter [Deltaproteobacteria bacterium]
MKKHLSILPLLAALLCLGAAAGSVAMAEEATEAAMTVTQAVEAAGNAQTAVNFVWICMAAFLVFFMQAGFAMVEAGFTRAKNVCNIIMKNLLDFSVGSIAFFILGFGIMFGSDVGGFLGSDQFLLSGTNPATPDGMWNYAFWLFQCVFAATAATIVSGAMAERTKFVAYLIYSAFICLFIYPISGHWIWGGGWLSAMKTPMVDFAGSSVVHSVGGWLGLAGALMLGPREGKYTAEGRSKAIPGHNILAGALGVFILWFGWFGFNPGSTTEANSSIGLIAVTTNLAAASGVITAMITAWFRFGKPDVTMSLNGALAGLVAITAGCANVSPGSAIIIGALAGIVVVVSVEFIDKVLKIDDPVGAISVHGVCGAFGTICVGIFANKEFGGVSGLLDGGGTALLVSQLIGVAAIFAWSFILGLILFAAIKATVGLRVSRTEELRGLDIEEHGNEAYYGFQIYTTE